MNIKILTKTDIKREVEFAVRKNNAQFYKIIDRLRKRVAFLEEEIKFKHKKIRIDKNEK